MNNKLRVAMLISGGGSTAVAIVNACKPDGQLTYVKPVLVIASRPDAFGIVRLMRAGMPDNDVIVIERKNYTEREAFGDAILRECKKRGVDFIG